MIALATFSFSSLFLALCTIFLLRPSGCAQGTFRLFNFVIFFNLGIGTSESRAMFMLVLALFFEYRVLLSEIIQIKKTKIEDI